MTAREQGPVACSLPTLAVTISAALDEHFPVGDRQVRQVLALCEEAGELAEAYAAWSQALLFCVPEREECYWWSEVEAELADVAITTYVTAHVLGSELPTETGPEHNRPPWYLPDEGHILALSAAVGAFAGAWRRHAGMARRTGSQLEVDRELVDVHGWLCRTAIALNIDLDRVCAAKAEVITSRGWREPRPAVSGEVTR